MLDAQDGLCWICRIKLTTKTGTTETICVDHCHKTGKRRALLCRRCNSGLGMFKDDAEIVFRASIYLEVFAS